MRLEHLEAHLNELLHDLNSPLSSMRLQLGLLREELRSEPHLLKRVENTERQLLRAQRIIDAFVSACRVKPGSTPGGEVVRRVFGRFEIPVQDDSGDAAVALKAKALDMLIRAMAEGCLGLMESGSHQAVVAASTGVFVVRVFGSFDQKTMARALRLACVGEDGEPQLALAITRIAASAANGTLLVERNALVLRLPLVTE